MPARTALTEGADRVWLAIYMAGNLDHAMTDLPPRPPSELFDRFLRWTHPVRDEGLVQA